MTCCHSGLIEVELLAFHTIGLMILTPRNSISESDLTTAGRHLLQSGFPPGITVDELWLYRKGRPSANLYPLDNLKLDEGSFKQLKSEYTRRFKNFYDFGSCGELALRREELSPVRATKPDDTFKLDEGSNEHIPEYNETFIGHSIEKPRRFKPILDSLQLIDYPEMKKDGGSSEAEKLLTENKSKYISYSGVQRPELIKRSTNLKLEGDLYTKTEQAEKFIAYLLSKRPEVIRKSTNLKMEGEIDTKTETREKFIPFEYQTRPPLCKKFTNLHLEGDLNILTENREKFTPYPMQKRPPLTKKSTNLHVEGELDLQPEYRREFIEYKAERRKLALPVDNLKTDGFYDELMADVSTPFEQQMHPQIPFLRGLDGVTGNSACGSSCDGRISARKREIIPVPDEQQIEIITENNRRQHVRKSVGKVAPPLSPLPLLSPLPPRPPSGGNHLKLEGSIEMNPEYRNAYIDFNKDGKVEMRTRRGQPPVANLKAEGKMEISPEYSSSYVDFPRERPKMKRPECNLSSEGEMDHMTEQNEKFQAFMNAPRTESVKREPELKLEGRFECQPEYRKAYINYLTREKVERKPRPLDHFNQQPKRAIEIEPVIKTALVPEIPIIPPNIQETPRNVTKITPPSPKQQSDRIKSGSTKNLAQLETELFGPKLTVPSSTKKTPSSRSISPKPPMSTKRKSRSLPRTRNLGTTSTDSDTAGGPKTFSKPILVQNLALGSRLPPAPISNVSTRNNWMRSSSVESSSAFVVLDKEINNNYTNSAKNGYLMPPRRDRHM